MLPRRAPTYHSTYEYTLRTGIRQPPRRNHWSDTAAHIQFLKRVGLVGHLHVYIVKLELATDYSGFILPTPLLWSKQKRTA